MLRAAGKYVVRTDNWCSDICPDATCSLHTRVQIRHNEAHSFLTLCSWRSGTIESHFSNVLFTGVRYALWSGCTYWSSWFATPQRRTISTCIWTYNFGKVKIEIIATHVPKKSIYFNFSHFCSWIGLWRQERARKLHGNLRKEHSGNSIAE